MDQAKNPRQRIPEFQRVYSANPLDGFEIHLSAVPFYLSDWRFFPLEDTPSPRSVRRAGKSRQDETLWTMRSLGEPVRVCVETGEQFFSPETVERIHALIQGRRKPDKVIETLVYSFS